MLATPKHATKARCSPCQSQKTCGKTCSRGNFNEKCLTTTWSMNSVTNISNHWCGEIEWDCTAKLIGRIEDHIIYEFFLMYLVTKVRYLCASVQNLHLLWYSPRFARPVMSASRKDVFHIETEWSVMPSR